MSILFWPAMLLGYVYHILREGFVYGRKQCDKKIEKQVFKSDPSLEEFIRDKGRIEGRAIYRNELLVILYDPLLDTAAVHRHLVKKLTEDQ